MPPSLFRMIFSRYLLTWYFQDILTWYFQDILWDDIVRHLFPWHWGNQLLPNLPRISFQLLFHFSAIFKSCKDFKSLHSEKKIPHPLPKKNYFTSLSVRCNSRFDLWEGNIKGRNISEGKEEWNIYELNLWRWWWKGGSAKFLEHFTSRIWRMKGVNGWHLWVGITWRPLQTFLPSQRFSSPAGPAGPGGKKINHKLSPMTILGTLMITKIGHLNIKLSLALLKSLYLLLQPEQKLTKIDHLYKFCLAFKEVSTLALVQFSHLWIIKIKENI